MKTLYPMMDDNRRNAFTIFINKLIDLGKKDMTGIEIGCYAGESTEIFINSGLFKTFYCIDPWKFNNSSFYKTVKCAEQLFDKRFENNKIIRKIKDYSWNAVNNFQDESIDFIYVDGNHTYEACKKDLELYYPKIKKNGIVSGHDYERKYGVYNAVNEFFNDKFTFLFFEDNSWMTYKI